MNAQKAMLIGAMFGFCFSLFVTVMILSCFIAVVGGGGVGIPLWIFIITAVPFTCAFALLGYKLQHKMPSAKQLWTYSVMSALFISFYSSTIGILGFELLSGVIALEQRSGMLQDVAAVYDTIAVQMTVVNCTLLATVLLPLTIPLQRYAINLLLTVLHKRPAYTVRMKKAL